jgi:hypothetical protein
MRSAAPTASRCTSAAPGRGAERLDLDQARVDGAAHREGADEQHQERRRRERPAPAPPRRRPRGVDGRTPPGDASDVDADAATATPSPTRAPLTISSKATDGSISRSARSRAANVRYATTGRRPVAGGEQQVDQPHGRGLVVGSSADQRSMYRRRSSAGSMGRSARARTAMMVSRRNRARVSRASARAPGCRRRTRRREELVPVQPIDGRVIGRVDRIEQRPRVAPHLGLAHEQLRAAARHDDVGAEAGPQREDRLAQRVAASLAVGVGPEQRHELVPAHGAARALERR